MNKKEYVIPEMEITEFETEDILYDSGDDNSWTETEEIGVT